MEKKNSGRINLFAWEGVGKGGGNFAVSILPWSGQSCVRKG